MKEVWQEIMQGMAVKIISLTLLFFGIIFVKFIIFSSPAKESTKPIHPCNEIPINLSKQTNFTS